MKDINRYLVQVHNLQFRNRVESSPEWPINNLDPVVAAFLSSKLIIFFARAEEDGAKMKIKNKTLRNSLQTWISHDENLSSLVVWESDSFVFNSNLSIEDKRKLFEFNKKCNPRSLFQ